jgi:hypothetical protein
MSHIAVALLPKGEICSPRGTKKEYYTEMRSKYRDILPLTMYAYVRLQGGALGTSGKDFQVLCGYDVSCPLLAEHYQYNRYNTHEDVVKTI